MNDNAIKNYAVWARRELMSEVEKRCAWWGISEDEQADVESIDGRVLSAQERKQRADLLRIVKADGFGQLVEKAAYTWFNRLLAIRFMEVNDRLPSHVRMLSSASGEFEPQCLREALDLPLDALDKDEAVKLVQAGDDEALFRLVFLAQCAELAECMPAVFEKVGSAMELLLPTGLLRRDGVVGQLVEQIPEDDWREGVEIVGWMYQYYASERKDEVFASFKKGKKAERDAIAPATQLFTPHWIVRYLTENSLGRLWMLNHPDSKLVDKMPYFIESDEEHETEFRRISSPEDVTCVDPACGSGHILVYAFELLADMYEAAGYSNRDAARLIIEKNITGLEIDPRAAAMASFALTMKACELDSRFLRRGVVPRITILQRVEFEPDELAFCPNLTDRTSLLDAVAHLDECGSLLQPDSDDLTAIERDLASLTDQESLFADVARAKLEMLLEELQPLAERFDVVVANPPYMGSGSMNQWMIGFVKQQYTGSRYDLCTCFIERAGKLAVKRGYIAMVTMQSWMFLSRYENMRRKLIGQSRIATMAHLGARAFDSIGGEVVSATAVVIDNVSDAAIDGVFIRLVDCANSQEKEIALRSAAKSHELPYVFKTESFSFEDIPGSPIAYWISNSMRKAFAEGQPMDQIMTPSTGMVTGNNDRFLRQWWEVQVSDTKLDAIDANDASKSLKRWFPYNKGGEYRKWYGNDDCLINWENDGFEILNPHKGETRHFQSIKREWMFCPLITWTKISTQSTSFRYKSGGQLFDKAGASLIASGKEDDFAYLALCNSTVIEFCLEIIAPGLNYQSGDIGKLPTLDFGNQNERIIQLASECIEYARSDWDETEASWGFVRHSLI